MQEQREFGGGTAGGVGREQPVELVGLAADLVAMQGYARHIVAGPALGAAGGDDAKAFRLDKFDPAGIGKVSSAGSTIWIREPWAPEAESPASISLISLIGDHKSDSTTTSASADGTKDGGRLARAASSCSIACAILSITLRLAVGFIRPGMPTRSPPETKSSASANVTISPRSSLLSRDCLD